MSFKPIDPKRDEIRRYLERGSVLDSLTKIFIRVIKERPENPLEYIRNNIGVVRHQHDKYERLQQDLQIANDEIQRLRDIINSINPDVLKGLVPVAQAKAPELSESQAAGGEVNEPVEQQKNGVPEEAEPVVQELSAAVEACQVEDKKENESPAVPAAATPSPTSVQIEANTSTDNTE